MRVWVLGAMTLVVAMSGCEARYDSLFPRVAAADGGGTPPDAGHGDGGLPDQGRADVLLSGVLEGRSGYAATGSVQLVRASGGGLELRFSEDFSAAGVPSPVVLLTTRASVTGGVQPGLGDLSLGPLSSVVGAQAYAVPEAGSGAAFAFVYCLPFTVEVARAPLEPLP